MKTTFKRVLQLLAVAGGAALLLVGIIFIRGSGVQAENATSTDSSLSTSSETRINELEIRVTSLETEVEWLFSHWSTRGSTVTQAQLSTGPAFIEQQGRKVHAGSNIDFGGHNFGSEEHVRVTLSGSQVANGLTNLEGSFTTGSITVPSTKGTYTYIFTGLSSGRTAQATITVVP